MAFSGAVFNRLYNWVQDAANAVAILPDRMDSEFANYKAGLEALLLRSGANSPAADIDWGGFRLKNLGASLADTDVARYADVAAIQGATNILRNGGFTVQQRGSPFTGITSGVATLDGWRFYSDGTGTANVGDAPVENVISAPSAGSVLDRAILIIGTSIGTSTKMGIEQRIEAPRQFSGETFGLMVFTKENGGGYPIVGEWGVFYGTGGSPSATVTGAINFDAYTPTSNGNRITAKFTVSDIVSGKTFGSFGDSYFYIRLYTKSAVFTGAGDLFSRWFTGAMLLPSDGAFVPTRFRPRPFAQELSICQRYYESSFLPGLVPAQGLASAETFLASAFAVNQIQVPVPFLVQKAKTPVVTVFRSSLGGVASQIAYFAGGSWVNASASTPNPALRSFYVSATAATGAGSSFLTNFNWTADAEL